MNPCSVCEGTDYHVLNGSYFCAVCGTKCEGEHEMDTDIDFTNKSFLKTRIKSVKKIRTGKCSFEMTVQESSWSNYEIYQGIMQFIVDSLIELGANRRLKDLVFQLWMKHLSENKIAFTDKQSEKLPKTPKSSGKEKSKSPKGNSKLNNTANLEEDMAVDDEHESDNDDDTNELLHDEYDKHLSKWKRIKYRQILAFCYVGLMYTNPLTTVSDILRWVEEYRIPFLNGYDYIPEKCKRTSQWNSSKMKYFSTVRIQIRLREDVNQLIHNLQLKDFPEFCLDRLVKKYIILFDLPGDMQSLCSRFVGSLQIKLCVPTTYRKSYQLQFVECTALSYIIMVLKLLFGLNDHTERELSSCSRKLMELQSQDQHLFVFEDWLKFMKIKELYATLRNSSKYSNSQLNSEDGGEETASGQSSKVQSVFTKQSKTMEDIQTVSQSEGGLYTVASSYTESDIKLRGEYFRNCSLRHITHPRTFNCANSEGQGQDGVAPTNVDGEVQFSSLFKRRKMEEKVGKRSLSDRNNKEQIEEVVQYIQSLSQTLHSNYNMSSDQASMTYDDVMGIFSNFIRVQTSELEAEVAKTEDKHFNSKKLEHLF